MARRTGPGLPLRAAAASPQPRLLRRRHRDAGARDRRDDRGVQRHERGRCWRRCRTRNRASSYASISRSRTIRRTRNTGMIGAAASRRCASTPRHSPMWRDALRLESPWARSHQRRPAAAAARPARHQRLLPARSGPRPFRGPGFGPRRRDGRPPGRAQRRACGAAASTATRQSSARPFS